MYMSCAMSTVVEWRNTYPMIDWTIDLPGKFIYTHDRCNCILITYIYWYTLELPPFQKQTNKKNKRPMGLDALLVNQLAIGESPEVAHMPSFYPRGIKLNLFLLYGQRFLRYWSIFKIAIFGHETWQVAKFPEVAHIQWSLRFRTPLFNKSLHFKTRYQ